MPLCQQDPSYFIAAQKGDVDKVTKMMNKWKNNYDRRETNPEQDVYQGFGAIHYACFYNRVDIVKLLLPIEILMETQQPIAFHAASFSPASKYKLSENSSCLMIALLKGNDQVVDIILEYLKQNEEKAKDFLGRQNAMGLTNYVITTLCRGDWVQKVLANELLLQREFKILIKGDITPIFNAAFFGRLVPVQELIRLSELQDYKEAVFEMALQRDSQLSSAIELCQMEIDYEKFGTTKEERDQVLVKLIELVKMAFEYAKNANQDPKWQQILQGFKLEKSDDELFAVVKKE